MTKVDSGTFKRTLISTNWNYAETARRLGLSRQAVQDRSKKIPRPEEFINIEHRGPKMKISPELKDMAIRYPKLRKQIALKETINNILETNIRATAKKLGITPSSISYRLRKAGGITAIAGRQPHSNIKISHSIFRAVAKEHPELRRELGLQEVIEDILRTGSVSETAKNLGTSNFLVSKRLGTIGGFRKTIGKQKMRRVMLKP